MAEVTDCATDVCGSPPAPRGEPISSPSSARRACRAAISAAVWAWAPDTARPDIRAATVARGNERSIIPRKSVSQGDRPPLALYHGERDRAVTDTRERCGRRNSLSRCVALPTSASEQCSVRSALLAGPVRRALGQERLHALAEIGARVAHEDEIVVGPFRCLLLGGEAAQTFLRGA